LGTRPDRSWKPSSLLYNGYRVSFPGVNRPGCGIDHPPHLAPRLKKEYSCTPVHYLYTVLCTVSTPSFALSLHCPVHCLYTVLCTISTPPLRLREGSRVNFTFTFNNTSICGIIKLQVLNGKYIIRLQTKGESHVFQKVRVKTFNTISFSKLVRRLSKFEIMQKNSCYCIDSKYLIVTEKRT
jgi:hypothetical protein